MSTPDNLTALLEEIEGFAARYRVLLVPGGGLFADSVLKIQQAIGLSDDTAHWMAIMAQDHFGLLLADKLMSERVVSKVSDYTNSNTADLFVLLPFSYVKQNDELPHTWNVTSDSIAVWIGKKAKADFVLLVKSVDGIANPFEETEILAEVEANRLHLVDSKNVVDSYVAQLAPRFSGRLFVVNGNNPKRIDRIISGQDTICTEII